MATRPTAHTPPTTLSALDASAARRWAVLTRSALGARRFAIDALNVFPVPDADTGTNLFLTLEGAFDGVRRAGGRQEEEPDDLDDLAVAADGFARALLVSARGNSGVILSQIVRGVAEEIAELGSRGTLVMDGPALVRALRRADDLAWASVYAPADGTILTVSRAAVTAAETAGDELVEVVRAALEAARRALSDTTVQLEALSRAGVVDAGGAGYVVLLEALERVVSGEDPVPPNAAEQQLGPRGPATAPETGSAHPAFEVMFLLDDSDDDRVDTLRSTLAGLGDSLLVVRGVEALWNVHVHVDDIDAALAAGARAGRVHEVRVSAFDHGTRGFAVVAVAAGDGLGVVLESAGAAVVRLDPTSPAFTVDLVAAVAATDAAWVVVLPGDTNALKAALAAADSLPTDGITVSVVPSVSAVQQLAALALFDPLADPAATVARMTEASDATRTGAVEADRSGGELTGVVDSRVVSVGHDAEAVAAEVVDGLLADGGELLTIVVGSDAPQGIADLLVATVRRTRPEVEVTVVDGGQPGSLLSVGVE